MNKVFSKIRDGASRLFSSTSENNKAKLWLDRAEREVSNTKDALMLCQRERHFVFVYDEMMQSYPKNGRLEGATYVGEGFTDQTSFTLYREKLGTESRAIALRTLDKPLSARIKGEVYAVPSGQVILLDKHKGNQVHFKRKRVEINIPYRVRSLKEDETGTLVPHLHPENNLSLSAWMYVGIPEYWDEVLDAGYLYGKAELFFPKKEHVEPYYYFTKKAFLPDSVSERLTTPFAKEELEEFMWKSGKFSKEEIASAKEVFRKKAKYERVLADLDDDIPF